MDRQNDNHIGETVGNLPTPSLLLDAPRMHRNIARLKTRLRGLQVPLRPHLKTAKSVKVARLMMESSAGPATVSTLKEAEWFAAQGVRDILYAVGIVPQKLDRVAKLRADGVDLSLILDCCEQADAVAATSRAAGNQIPALIEIDSDGHRSGVKSDDDLLIEIGRRLHEGGATLKGIVTHAGASYDCADVGEITRMAETERAAAVRAAERLRAAGLPSPIVSVGSTPTAHFAADLKGVTEVRAGVFVFFDLVMAGLGVCTLDDIAISVLARVIGHQREKSWIIIDAGWMALSRDRGTAKQKIDQGYGVVCDATGKPYPDLIVAGTNQEHGVVAIRPGSQRALPELKVGDLVRVFPNHACATGAQHDAYHVIESSDGRVHAVWPRISGW